MSQPPGRDTKSARSRQRTTWAAGDGTIATVEKDGFGLWIDDIVYAFADVSIPSVPTLYVVLTTAGIEFFGVKNAAMIAWMTMVVGAGTIRGGWITPFGTDVPGWVSITPSLVVLRLVYYNAVLAVAAYGGGVLGTTMGLPLASVAFAFLVAVVAVGAFPRIAEEYCRRLSSRSE